MTKSETLIKLQKSYISNKCCINVSYSSTKNIKLHNCFYSKLLTKSVCWCYHWKLFIYFAVLKAPLKGASDTSSLIVHQERHGVFQIGPWSRAEVSLFGATEMCRLCHSGCSPDGSWLVSSRINHGLHTIQIQHHLLACARESRSGHLFHICAQFKELRFHAREAFTSALHWDGQREANVSQW